MSMLKHNVEYKMSCMMGFHRAEERREVWSWNNGVNPLSSFDTMSIWETTSLKVTVVSMVTGRIEEREEGGTKCSACWRGGGGRRSRTWLPACSSHLTTNNVWFIFWTPLLPSVSPSNQLSLLPPSLSLKQNTSEASVWQTLPPAQ